MVHELLESSFQLQLYDLYNLLPRIFCFILDLILSSTFKITIIIFFLLSGLGTNSVPDFRFVSRRVYGGRNWSMGSKEYCGTSTSLMKPIEENYSESFYKKLFNSLQDFFKRLINSQSFVFFFSNKKLSSVQSHKQDQFFWSDADIKVSIYYDSVVSISQSMSNSTAVAIGSRSPGYDTWLSFPVVSVLI